MRKLLFFLALVLVLPSAASAGRKDTTLSVIGYSIPTAVFPKLFSAYQATSQGQGVKFTSSFAASEVQSKAVAAGLPADVVNFSISTDMDRLVQSGQVSKSWDANPYHGIVSKSVVVFVLRNGNPKHIKTWDDLTKPGVQVVAANPFTSGGARWNVLAAYGSQLREGKKPGAATGYLLKLFQHVVSQDSSGRNALNTFLSGKGDVLLTYENEAKLAQAQGKPVFYVIPKATIRIENPVAVTTDASDPAAAKAFVAFLHTPAAQKIYGQNGYRPVDQEVVRQFNYPVRPWLFTIQRFGGWARVQKQFFDPKTGIVTRIEQSLGH